MGHNYIINRLFPVPFSNTYDDSVLVLDIASVFCVLKFAFEYQLRLGVKAEMSPLPGSR